MVLGTAMWFPTWRGYCGGGGTDAVEVIACGKFNMVPVLDTDTCPFIDSGAFKVRSQCSYHSFHSHFRIVQTLPRNYFDQVLRGLVGLAGLP